MNELRLIDSEALENIDGPEGLNELAMTDLAYLLIELDGREYHFEPDCEDRLDLDDESTLECDL